MDGFRSRWYQSSVKRAPAYHRNSSLFRLFSLDKLNTESRRADSNRIPAPATSLFTRFLVRPELSGNPLLSVLLFGGSETAAHPVRTSAYQPGCGTIAVSLALRQRCLGRAVIEDFIL